MKQDILPVDVLMGELRSMIAKFSDQAIAMQKETREIQRMASRGRFVKLRKLLGSCSETDFTNIVLPYLLSHPQLDFLWEVREGGTLKTVRLNNTFPLEYAPQADFKHPKHVTLLDSERLKDSLFQELAHPEGLFSQTRSYREFRSHPSLKAKQFYEVYASSSAILKLERIEVELFKFDLEESEQTAFLQFVASASNLKELIIRKEGRTPLPTYPFLGKHPHLEVLRLRGVELLDLSALKDALRDGASNLIELDVPTQNNTLRHYLDLIDDFPQLKHLTLGQEDFQR